MGMAASQARYLALTARKSNIEYEGQQINQSRMALSSQSANLFSKMLGMSVPTAPDTSEYTTLQYSWTDGTNVSTMEKYTQLASDNDGYNYVVTSYHNENVYTGSRKKLSSPQVQAAKTDHYYYGTTSTEENRSTNVAKAWTNADGTYGIETTGGSTAIYRAVTTAEEGQVRALNAGNGVADATATVDLTDASVKAGFSKVATTDANNINNVIKLYALDETTTPKASEVKAGTKDYYTNGSGGYVTSADYATAAAGTTVTQGKGLDVGTQTYYTDGTTFVTKADLDSAVTTYDSNVANNTKNLNTITELKPENDATYSNYTAVGNSALTELTTTDMAATGTKAEIDQIIKDMKSSTSGDTVSAENFAACFTTNADGSTTYKGGIYKFALNGTTYYTTQKDLAASAGSALATNQVDNQQEKLSYYTAGYVSQKIEDTQKALIETDGTGRFSTLKLENDSTPYSLDASTVTDTAAYNDAMNAYYYNQKVYDKTVADINAKTEIIQAQDKELELRLEQLNTEQSALQNEMESVKKVVDKHVELGFKTFGG